jgi:hypothetical protein
MVRSKINSPGELEKVHEIVPDQSELDPSDLSIFEMNENDGTIIKLGDYKGLPSDDNYLNDRLGETNELFTNLQEIENGWR